ncbi:MAG: hypothetical protein A4E49_00074 [Methanosaeta sp. PtaU1.Bin112]|nr:MAG: hypothetical protein A4E49_00074 [Methanosaeta sp. PtaU1.Bin112]
MRWILVCLLLIDIVSAESVNLGNHTIEFNMSRPHEVDNDRDTLLIKSFDGSVLIIPNAPDPSIDAFRVEAIKIDNASGTLSFLKDEYAATYKKDGEWNAILSSLPIYQTADFLRSLHIEKRSA